MLVQYHVLVWAHIYLHTVHTNYVTLFIYQMCVLARRQFFGSSCGHGYAPNEQQNKMSLLATISLSFLATV